MSESAWERYLAHTPPNLVAERAAAMVAATAAWDVDMLVDTHRGEKFWLGPCLNEKGERIGITECCPEDQPCQRHAERSMERPS